MPIFTKESAAKFISDAKAANKSTPAQIAAFATLRRINGNRNHGWGAKDSLFILAAIWLSETGDAMSDEIEAQFLRYINPSAMRQYLESKKINLLDKGETSGKGADDLASELTA
jgi:hypothetical protein